LTQLIRKLLGPDLDDSNSIQISCSSPGSPAPVRVSSVLLYKSVSASEASPSFGVIVSDDKTKERRSGRFILGIDITRV